MDGTAKAHGFDESGLGVEVFREIVKVVMAPANESVPVMSKRVVNSIGVSAPELAAESSTTRRLKGPGPPTCFWRLSSYHVSGIK